ncbi:unnamed protein product [marine sediment metagenome]|uniref:Uncharacterized protein n=1 Tax=marine sediment metagenome TaxID=412755 RepID=X1SJS9_9ZZZZ
MLLPDLRDHDLVKSPGSLFPVAADEWYGRTTLQEFYAAMHLDGPESKHIRNNPVMIRMAH